MATAPQIFLPDGSDTTLSLNLTTNSRFLSFRGIVESNAIDIQISINNSGFVSDPSLVFLTLPSFRIPNPNVFSNGLELGRGVNTIRLRSVDTSGNVSPTSQIRVEVLDSEEGFFAAQPTGIRVQRNATNIKLQWEVLDPLPSLVGFNVYASTAPGGSESGYLRVNRDPIPSSDLKTAFVDETVEGTSSLEFENPGDTNNLLPIEGQLNQATIQIDSFLRNASNNTLFGSVDRVNLFLGIAKKYRLDLSLVALNQNSFYEFTHDRNSGLAQGVLNTETWSILNPDSPLYYVVTALYYIRSTGDYVESLFSQEIAASTLNLDTTIRGIRIREQASIVQDFIREISRTEPTLSLIPGSTIRETFIEPFSNEAEKAYFLMDFVHRAKSFQALLQIDDPNFTGTSVLVSNSTYKTNLRAALSLSSDAAVQSLIDGAFDSLAANFNSPRRGARFATVNQTFFTTTAPTTDLTIDQGTIVASSSNGAAPRFVTNGSAVLPASDARSFFNPETRRFEIRLQMIAETPGSFGNLPAGSLDTIVSGANGFSTINDSASTFGQDSQSNLQLAEEASRKLSSLDTGTEGGYQLTAIGTPGVQEVGIVKSGDRLMMRDYDEIRGKHIGGKVDIYVKGVVERNITETFAFQFDIASNIRFDVIDPQNLIFRARDSRLTESNPIAEMLSNPSQGLGLRNLSSTPFANYDLTGVTIIDFQTISLNTAIPQPDTFLDDFVEGDYRFRSNNKFIPSFQPVRRITSVVGEISGALDAADGFTLFKTQDPLLEGESTIAQNSIEINQVDNVPTGEVIPVNNEFHIMIGSFEEPLDSVGINSFSLRVFSEDRLTEFRGPNDNNPDYIIIEGSQTTPLKIVRTTNSNIVSGTTVSVDYEKDENFSVTYVINDVLQQVQNRVNSDKHVTADVVVKQSLENQIALEATYQLSPNADRALADTSIRTNITTLTERRGVGGSIRISDSVATIDNTAGVDFVVQPFARHTLRDGSIRIRDEIPSSSIRLNSLDQFNNAVYLLTEPVPFDTSDGGGNETQHKGVFKDEIIMVMSNSLENVGSGLNRSWIIGREGAIITGYSDDQTLLDLGFESDELESERQRRTANRAVISLDASSNPPDTPNQHSFAISYVVSGDRNVKDIEASEIESISPGDVTLTSRSSDGNS